MSDPSLSSTDVPEKYKLVYSALYLLDLESVFPHFMMLKLTDALFCIDFIAAESRVANSIQWQHPCDGEGFIKQLKAAIAECTKRRRSGRLNPSVSTAPDPLSSPDPPPSSSLSKGASISHNSNHGRIGTITNNHFVLANTAVSPEMPKPAAPAAAPSAATIPFPLPLKLKNRIDEIVKGRLTKGLTLKQQRNGELVMKQLFRVLQLEFEYLLCDKIVNGVATFDAVVDENQKSVKKHVSTWLSNTRNYSKKKQHGTKTPTECRKLFDKMQV